MPRIIRVLMLLENASFPDDARVRLQAEALTAAAYEVSIICPTDPDSKLRRETVQGVQVFRYRQPPEWGGLLGYMLEYGYSIVMQFFLSLYVLIRYGFDAIHMHTPPDMNAIIPAFYRLFGKKFIYDLHDLSPELYQAQRQGKGNPVIKAVLLVFEKFACRNANLLIATNETQRNVQIQRGRADSSRCVVVRNGPSEAFLEVIEVNDSLRNHRKTIIGYVGVMGRQDGVDFLIRAVDFLANERKRQDFQVVLVGDGASKKELVQLVHSHGLNGCVQFTGRVPYGDVPAIIASFDICSTPDPSDPYNDSCTTIKTMEYMALGKPVVCFETPENMKTAEQAALYAKSNDIRQYALLIEQLMDDAELRKRMGQIGRQRIEQQLAWEHQASHLISAYDSLFGTKRGADRKSSDQQPASYSRVAIKSGDSAQLDTRNGAEIDLSVRERSQGSRQPWKATFAFNGPAEKVFEEHLSRDISATQLTALFRIYYLLRPLIPVPLRQVLQRTRNRSLKLPENWYIPEAFLSELHVALRGVDTDSDCGKIIHPWPDGYQYAVALTHDIETRDGQKEVNRLAGIEEKLGLRSAWYFVSHKYTLDYGLIRELKERGHEVGIHGYNHDGRLFATRAIFEYRAKLINEAGQLLGASGFRSPMVHRNLEWMQALEFDYDASCFDIDPFQAMPGGVGSIWPFMAGRLVELPYTLPQDHTLLLTLGESSPRLWIRKFELLRQVSGMALLVTHPDYLNARDRLFIYQLFCEHIAQAEGKWLALPSEVAQWWRARHASSVQADGSILGPAENRGRIMHLSSLLSRLESVQAEKESD